MKGYRNLYLFAILAIGAAIFLRFIWPIILRSTVDSVIGNEPLAVQGWMKAPVEIFFNFLGGKSLLEQSLWICSLILLLLTISRGIFIFLKGKLSARASEAIGSPHS